MKRTAQNGQSATKSLVRMTIERPAQRLSRKGVPLSGGKQGTRSSPVTLKMCSRCKQMKPHTEFYRLRTGALVSCCKQCYNDRNKTYLERYSQTQLKRREETKQEWNRVHVKERAVYARVYQLDHVQEQKIRGRAYYVRTKDKVFAAYGGYRCACCGETIRDFLTLDHINGGGTADRRARGGGFYLRLIRRGFPDGFQVLCFNCNWGRHRNGGVCPHQLVTERDDIVSTLPKGKAGQSVARLEVLRPPAKKRITKT